MVAKQSRNIHHLVLMIATTTVMTNQVLSLPVLTTNAPSTPLKGPSPGPPTPAAHGPLDAKSPTPKVPDGPPQHHPAPHQGSTIAPGVVRPSISSAPMIATSNSKTRIEKIDLWLAPICEQLEKIVPKQAFKIQSQFKRIVELTNGKLSICFMEHYKFDPSLNPISKAQMTNVCNSRSSSHFRAFVDCAVENWDVSADQELETIINARNDHVNNHKHDYKDGEFGAPSLLHGDDEVKIILNDVVTKALSDSRSDHGKKSDIKMIDLSDKNQVVPSSARPQPMAPSGHPIMPAKKVADVPNVEKKILNDPNTVMVFMDDSKPTSHPSGPPNHSSNLFGPPTASTTAIPHTNGKTKPLTTTKPTGPPLDVSAPKAASQTTGRPNPTNNPASKLLQSTTVKPVSSITKKQNSAEPLPTSTSKKPASEPAKQVSTTTVMPNKSASKQDSKATGAPSSRTAIESHTASATTTTTVTPRAKPSTTYLPTKVSTERPLETLDAVLKRQEAEKIEFEKKLKMEREAVIRKLQKKQDEVDAQNAIAAMQSHRDHATDHDSRMHQIEHERQMSIDPIGHTLKHQQFELRKQQRFGG